MSWLGGSQGEMERMRAEQVRPEEMALVVGKDELAQARRNHEGLDAHSKREKKRGGEELLGFCNAQRSSR